MKKYECRLCVKRQASTPVPGMHPPLMRANPTPSMQKRVSLVILQGPQLKGHGNEADFLGFLHKSVPHESLTLPFEPFQFWLRIRGDIEKRLPDSLSRGVDKIANGYKFCQTFK